MPLFCVLVDVGGVNGHPTDILPGTIGHSETTSVSHRPVISVSLDFFWENREQTHVHPNVVLVKIHSAVLCE